MLKLDILLLVVEDGSDDLFTECGERLVERVSSRPERELVIIIVTLSGLVLVALPVITRFGEALCWIFALLALLGVGH